MYRGGNQAFASPEEALSHISEQAWSDYTKADYTIEQWHAACLIHIHDGEPTSKSQCKLPVKTPNGALNRNGVHAAAAALAGARGGLKGVSDDQKNKAAAALRRYYSQLDEDAPESLVQSNINFREKPGSPEEILEHFGVKGMRWGVRKTNTQFAKSERLRSKAYNLDEKSSQVGSVRAKALQGLATRKRKKSGELRYAVTSKVMAQTNKAARKELAGLRKKSEFQNINYRDERGHPKFDYDKYKALEKAESKIWVKHLNNTVSGYKFDVKVSKSGDSWDLIPQEVKHAETSIIRVKPIRDEDGFLIDVKLVDIQEDMTQSAVDLGSDLLEHHGVKGMKWGVRKKEETGGQTSAGKVKPPERTSSGQVKPPPLPKSLSERNQRRVDKFINRSEIANTKISELKLRNEKLQGTRNPAKQYERYINKQDIKSLDKAQRRALKDAEAVKKGKLTSTQKKMIIGGVAVGAIAAGVMVYRGQQSGALNSYKLLAQARLGGKKVPFNINDELRGPMSAKDLLNKVAKPVNPNYSSMGGKMNCRRATYAYELRRRGFDVHATTSAVGWGQSESGVINALTTEGDDFFRRMSMSEAVVKTGGSTVARGDTRINPVKKIVLEGLSGAGSQEDKASAARILANVKKGRPIWEGAEMPSIGSKRVFEELGKQPNGARGEVLFKFPGFGHSMAYEVVDGKPHIFDSQKGTYHDLIKTVEDKWGAFDGAEITRLDDVDLDLNFLTRWATNRG